MSGSLQNLYFTDPSLLLKGGAFGLGALVGFLTAYFSTGKPGSTPKLGFNLLLYTGEYDCPTKKNKKKECSECLHIHHYMYVIPLVIVAALLVWLAQGEFTMMVLFILGFGIGLSLDDFTFPDWDKFKMNCETGQYLG
jgi:hypothetical protein